MELKQFLDDSPLAEKIKLESRVVIHRCQLSQDDLQTLPEGLGVLKESLCELEIAGQVMARGRIIKRGDAYFFKVTKMDTNPQNREVYNAK